MDNHFKHISADERLKAETLKKAKRVNWGVVSSIAAILVVMIGLSVFFMPDYKTNDINNSTGGNAPESSLYNDTVKGESSVTDEDFVEDAENFWDKTNDKTYYTPENDKKPLSATAAPVSTNCPLANNTPTVEENVNNAGADIYYKVIWATKTQCKVKIINMSCTHMTFGKAFYLEKEVNGNFEKVQWKREAYFYEIAYLLKSDESVEMIYDWKDFLGQIEEGKYRIVTDFYRDGEKITAYFTFKI